MICDNLSSWKKNMGSLNPSLKKALEWAEASLKSPPAPGKYPLEAGTYVIVQTYLPKEWKGTTFENHRKFIDVQVIAKGNECILWTKPQPLKTSKPYVDANDAELFSPDPAKEYTCLMMAPGSFAIFWPSDWHIPGLQTSRIPISSQQLTEVLKFVVKVPVEQ
jgi:YhcH/YjgK/YiaL family protein